MEARFLVAFLLARFFEERFLAAFLVVRFFAAFFVERFLAAFLVVRFFAARFFAGRFFAAFFVRFFAVAISTSSKVGQDCRCTYRIVTSLHVSSGTAHELYITLLYLSEKFCNLLRQSIEIIEQSVSIRSGWKAEESSDEACVAPDPDSRSQIVPGSEAGGERVDRRVHADYISPRLGTSLASPRGGDARSATL